MIHEIAVELGAALAAKGCPLKVFDGPENTQTTTGARERIVVEHDESGDSFAPVRGQHKNPKLRAICNVGVKVTISAQAANVAAQDWEHRRRAEHARDLVLCALYVIAENRKNAIAFSSGRFVDPPDLAQSPVIAGAVYELKFTIERGIADVTWAGDKRPEMTVGSSTVKSTTQVNLATSTGSPQTGCGA